VNLSVSTSLRRDKDGYLVRPSLQSFKFADFIITATVADDEIARPMDYLNSATVGVGLDVLQDYLVRYQNYYSLSYA
jgi:hypothetical protein